MEYADIISRGDKRRKFCEWVKSRDRMGVGDNGNCCSVSEEVSKSSDVDYVREERSNMENKWLASVKKNTSKL